MPSLDDLTARVERIETQLGITPTPNPAGAPAKPAPPLVTLTDIGLRLDVTPDPGADRWRWRDELDPNPATRVKAETTVPWSLRSPMRPDSRPRRYSVQAGNSAGWSEWSDAVDVPDGATPDPAPTPVPAPAFSSGVDLDRWKLTLPIRKDGKVVEIRPPFLTGYSDEYWTPLPGGGYRCRVWHGGDTTSGSSNPRTELRERVGDDPEGYWDAGQGVHVMEWTGQVNRLTKVKPHVVIGQVHDDTDDVVVLRLEADKLWLTNGDNPHGFLVDPGFMLGKPYTCRFEVVNGEYGFVYNGRPLPYTLRSTAPSYFKVGAYGQTNPKTAPSESPDEYFEVELHSVTVTHS